MTRVVCLEHVIYGADSQQRAELGTAGWEVGLGTQVAASKVKKMFTVCALELCKDLLACEQILAHVVVYVVVH